MAKTTEIAWSDSTWSPWHGCLKVSPGCTNCYAETLSHRWGYDIWGPEKTTRRRVFGDKHWAKPIQWNAEALRERKRRKAFPSMCDPFEENQSLIHERNQLWALIKITPNIDWLLTTKRPENILQMIPSEWREKPPHNVWYLTSIESPDYLWRADELRQVPAIVRGISYEPALAWVDWSDHLEGIHWLIAGGESGAKARPCSINWLRKAYIDCAFTGTACFVKQLGSKPLGAMDKRLKLKDYKGADPTEWPDDLQHYRQFPVGYKDLVPA